MKPDIQAFFTTDLMLLIDTIFLLRRHYNPMRTFASLTLSLLMSYIHGAPSKARNLTSFVCVYIYVYIYIYGQKNLLGIFLLEPCISLIHAWTRTTSLDTTRVNAHHVTRHNTPCLSGFQFCAYQYLFVHSSTIYFGRPFNRLPWLLLSNTWMTSPSLHILLTRPIQFNRLILTNESISKSTNSSIKSVLNRFLQIPFSLIPPRTFFFKLSFQKQPAVQQYLYLLSISEHLRYAIA
jgi:hypothetical protein